MKINVFKKAVMAVGMTALVALFMTGCQLRGMTGAKGEQGIQGEQGVQGEQGIQGEQGTPGNFSVIVFNTAGGGDISPVLIENGKSLTLPTPKRFGYDFGGWFTGSGLDRRAVSDGETVKESMTVSASWSPKAVLWRADYPTEAGSFASFSYYHPEAESVFITIIVNGTEYLFDEAVEAGFIGNGYSTDFNGGMINISLFLMKQADYVLRLYNYDGEFTETPITVGSDNLTFGYAAEGGRFNGVVYENADNPTVNVFESELLSDEPFEVFFDATYDTEAISATNNGEAIDIISQDFITSYQFAVAVDTSGFKVGENKVEVKINNVTFGECSAFWTINIIPDLPTENTVLYTDNFYSKTHDEGTGAHYFDWFIYCVNGEEAEDEYSFVYNFRVVDEAGEEVKYVSGEDLEFSTDPSFNGKMLSARFSLKLNRYEDINQKYLLPGKYKIIADISTAEGALIASSEFDYYVWERLYIDIHSDFNEVNTGISELPYEVASMNAWGVKMLPGEEKTIPYGSADIKLKFTVSEGKTVFEYSIMIPYTGEKATYVSLPILVETMEGIKYFATLNSGFIAAEFIDEYINLYVDDYKGCAALIREFLPQFIEGEGVIEEVLALYNVCNADFDSMTEEEILSYIIEYDMFSYTYKVDNVLEALGELPEGESWYDVVIFVRELVLETTGLTAEQLSETGPFDSIYSPDSEWLNDSYASLFEIIKNLCYYANMDKYDFAVNVFDRISWDIERVIIDTPEMLEWYLEVEEIQKEYFDAKAAGADNTEELKAEFVDKVFKLKPLFDEINTQNADWI